MSELPQFLHDLPLIKAVFLASVPISPFSMTGLANQGGAIQYLDLNEFWPGLRHRSWTWFAPTKLVCSAAMTWAPSPSDQHPSPGSSRRRSVRGHNRCIHACRLAVSEVRLALPNLDNIAIRIANVAARLAILFLWLCDKLGSSAAPQFIARLNICNADIHEAAD